MAEGGKFQSESGQVVRVTSDRHPRPFVSTPARQGEPTLEEHLREWLELAKPWLRISTWTGYRANLENHVIPALGHLRLSEVTPDLLNSLYARLLSGGHLRTKAGLSPSTVRQVHIALRNAIKEAVRSGRLIQSPVEYCLPPRAVRFSQYDRTWSPEEINTFLKVVSGDRLYAAWELAALTGMRRGEILGLRWMDLDLPRSQLHVRQTLLAVRDELVVSEPKTKPGRRTIPLPKESRQSLSRHRREVVRARKVAPDRSELVFLRPDGQPVHPDRFTREFSRIVKQTGLPKIRLHDLRHSFATLALASGVHPKLVSDVLGHAQFTVTLDFYSHVLPNLGEFAVQAVSNLVLDNRA